MADTSGLPTLKNTPAAPAPMTGEIPAPINIELGLGPSSKDVMIGGGTLLVLTVIFFFIRNAFVNYLVSSLKRSPNNAGLSGWGLFGGLLFVAAIGGIGLMSKSYLTMMYVAPLAALSLICFILCLVVASRA